MSLFFIPLGFENGAAHIEVICTANGPTLVEVNNQMHGGQANWRELCHEAHGYDQMSVYLDAYLDPVNYDSNILFFFGSRGQNLSESIFEISPSPLFVTNRGWGVNFLD